MRRFFLACSLAFLSVLGSASWAQEDAERDEALRRLEEMMQRSGVQHLSFSSMRLVKRQPSPIPGLETLVYDVMVDEGGRVEPRRIAVFTDKKRRYLVMGSIIDMENKQDLGEAAVASIKDRQVALSALQRVALLPRQSQRTVTVVIDLGNEKARRFLSDLISRRNTFKVHVDMALASNAQDQKAVGAQAIIAGSAGEEFFYDALSQWLRRAGDAAFLQPEKLRQDPDIQSRLGRGIFHIERNSTELLDAGVTRLPMLFVTDKSGVKQVALPKTEADWAKIFGSP